MGNVKGSLGRISEYDIFSRFTPIEGYLKTEFPKEAEFLRSKSVASAKLKRKKAACTLGKQSAGCF